MPAGNQFKKMHKLISYLCNMPFRFKQFVVDDSACPMKVGTDSVLLGAWANLGNKRNILDIGTGCGLLALMAAQRSQGEITGIDIDGQSTCSASLNFSNSPWAGRLRAVNISLQNYLMHAENGSFDHIVTNPPFFNNSLKSPEQSRNAVRHTDTLPFSLLAEASAKLLSVSGHLSLVLPVTEGNLFILLAADAGLYLCRKTEVVPTAGKAANRLLLEFSRITQPPPDDEIIMLRDSDRKYTEEYISLTRDFYLNF